MQFHLNRYSPKRKKIKDNNNEIYRGYYLAARRYEIYLRSLVKYFQHEKRNFVSPSGHVMFYLLYKHQ